MRTHLFVMLSSFIPFIPCGKKNTVVPEQCYSLSEQLLSMLISLSGKGRGKVVGEERSEEEKEEVRLVRCILNSAVRK